MDNLLDILKPRALEEGLPLRTILKETLQIFFLEGLYKLPESDEIIFQGGTCLRLLYGGARYSDDLDFVTSVGKEFLRNVFHKIVKSNENVGIFLQGFVEFRIQKEGSKLVRWKMYYFSGDRKENTSINIEFANYPFYTTQLLPLNMRRGFPFSGLVLVKAETEEEILADKIVAFAGRKYLKSRDIFDFWYLRSRGVKLNKEILANKFYDYSIPKKNLSERVILIDQQLVKKDLQTFLPKLYRDKFEKEGYKSLVEATKETIKQAIEYLSG